jgi:tetratricopeptide (TPR) repeat protein/predicted secreted protein
MSKKKFKPQKAQTSPQVTEPKKTQSSVVSQPSTLKNKSLIYFTAFIIAICGGLLYSNTSDHNYNLDDFSVIVENEFTVKGSEAIGDIFKHGYRTGMYFEDNLYRPLSKAMFAWEYELNDGKPELSHKVNIFIYSLLCGFVFLLLNRFFPQRFYLVLIASLLFAFHPIHTEVVANIKSRDEMLAMFFMVIGLWYAKSYGDTLKKSWLFISGISFFLALLSKESAITYVGLMPVTLYFFTELKWSKIFTAAGFIALVAVIYLLIHQSVIGGVGLKSINIADNSLMVTTNFLHQRMTAIEILGRYIYLLCYPHPLSCDYSFNTIPLVNSFGNGRFLLAFVLHLAGLYFAFKGWKKKEPYSYGILFYLITISIVSNVFMLIGTNMAERLVFLPSLGFCILVAWVITRLTNSLELIPARISDIFTQKALNWMLILPVLLFFSVKTIDRNKDWKNVKTLFDKDVNKVPNSVHMLYYHANMMTNSDTIATKTEEEKKKIYALAEKELRTALSILDAFPEVHSTLAKILQYNGEYREAIKHYERRLQLNNLDPTAYNNLGTCYGFMNVTDSAEMNFKIAIEKSSSCYADALCNMATAYINRGAISLQQNKREEAIKHYQTAIDYSNQTIACKWDTPLAYKYLGMAYEALGDPQKAKKYFAQGEQIVKNSLPAPAK